MNTHKEVLINSKPNKKAYTLISTSFTIYKWDKLRQ